jgi:hypothetical protein
MGKVNQQASTGPKQPLGLSPERDSSADRTSGVIGHGHPASARDLHPKSAYQPGRARPPASHILPGQRHPLLVPHTPPLIPCESPRLGLQDDACFRLAVQHVGDGLVDGAEVACLVDDLGASERVEGKDVGQVGPGAYDRADH